MSNLALLYEFRGKLDEGQKLLTRALAVSERVRGPKHADTITTMNNLARLYRAAGKDDQAQPLCVRAYQSSRELPEEHPLARACV